MSELEEALERSGFNLSFEEAVKSNRRFYLIASKGWYSVNDKGVVVIEHPSGAKEELLCRPDFVLQDCFAVETEMRATTESLHRAWKVAEGDFCKFIEQFEWS